MKIFGREPAVWLGLLAVVLQTLVAWGVHLTGEQQGAINAVVTFAMGLAIAVSVAREQIVPVAGSLMAAVLQLWVAFGGDVSQEQITTASAVVTAVLAAWLRTQVVARTGPVGEVVPRETPASPPGQ
jgi:hypothetical protein